MYPAAVFIMLIGGDSLRDLPSWHQPLEVIRQWKLAVLPRPDAPLNWELLERDVPGAQQATTLLDGPSVALSSTQIRRWIGHGRSLRYVVPQAVEQYIKANALYTT
jgi:nicotinate-nucleotide adenylyltransferase